MSSRLEFVHLARQGGANVRALCRQFGVAPATAYKWLKRFESDGEAGLSNMSRRPHTSPSRSSPALEAEVLSLHSANPHWGSRKLLALFPPERGTPHHSTIDAILHRHGRYVDHPPGESQAARLRFEHEAPNDLWQMDFKGHFALTGGSATRCHPLTILDDHSRFSLCLQAFPYERYDSVQAALVATFRLYGMPSRITCDNGPPWGTGGNRTMSRLDAWLIRLGIKPSHSRPHHPQTQGKDERFHRTLKFELDRMGFRSLQACQHAFNCWRDRYNLVRPHEALGQKAPVTRYRASNRPYPEVLPPVHYPEGSIVRKVRENATFSWKNKQYHIGDGLIGQHIEIRPAEVDGIINLYFCDRNLGFLDLRKME